MDFKKLSKVMDSQQVKINDSRRRAKMSRSLRDKIKDTESTEEAVQVAVDALEGEEPAEVIQAVVEVLGNTIDELEAKVNDSKGNRFFKKPKRKVRDFDKKEFARKLKDTESSEDATQVAIDALSAAEPEEVIGAVIEVLGNTVDELQTQIEDSMKKK